MSEVINSEQLALRTGAELHELGADALKRFKAGSAHARELVSSVDLGAVKAGGEGLVERARTEMAEIDLSAAKDRAMAVGQSIVRKTRKAVSSPADVSGSGASDHNGN